MGNAGTVRHAGRELIMGENKHYRLPTGEFVTILRLDDNGVTYRRADGTIVSLSR